MDTQTRHALKQDRFVETTASTLDWVGANRARVIRLSIAAIVVLAIIIGGTSYYHQRSNQASVALGKALEIYNTPLRQPGEPVQPGITSYGTSAERAQAANQQFVNAANSYGWLDAGKTARYFAGLTYLDIGKTSDAESNLKQVADSHDSNLAALAKVALAGLYVQTGKNQQAVDLYKQIIAHPTTTVPASAAQLQLAQLYETTDPQQAKQIYAVLKDKDKTTAAGQIATQKLNGGPAPQGPPQ